MAAARAARDRGIFCPRNNSTEAFMANVAKFPEAGPGIETATQAALWILGRTRQVQGADRAAKLALGFLLAGAAVARSEYGRDYAGWLLLALAEAHARAGHGLRPPEAPPAADQAEREYDQAASWALRRARPDPARSVHDRDRRRDRRSGG
jgi:hypothetical protein